MPPCGHILDRSNWEEIWGQPTTNWRNYISHPAWELLVVLQTCIWATLLTLLPPGPSCSDVSDFSYRIGSNLESGLFKRKKGFWNRIRSHNPVLVLIWIKPSVCVVQNFFVGLGYLLIQKIWIIQKDGFRVDFWNKCNKTFKLVKLICFSVIKKIK